MAKAKPARVEKTTVPAATVLATITVFSRAAPMFASVHATWRFRPRFPPNQNGGGVCASLVLLREAAIAVHISGKSELRR